MSTAARDANSQPTLIGVLSTDGTTITRVQVDASSHALQCSDGTTGSDHGGTNATHDENSTPTLLAVSSSDGITPVEVYVDSSNNLLIKST